MSDSIGRRSVLAGLAAVTASSALGQSKPGKWVQLGKRLVSFETETDVLPVGLHRGLFDGLRIEAAGNAVFIERLTVVFPKGEQANIPVRSVIGAGSRSRDMLLPGLVRAIVRIEIVYRRAKLGGAASLTFFGRRAR
jgi:hypothetical protein